jgi:protoheme ferro-lyase
MARTGVLIVSEGGPAGIADVPAFLEASLGRVPSEEELQSVRRMVLAIGGMSPVPAAMERIAAALERELNGLPILAEETDSTITLMTLAQAAAGRASEPVEIRVLVGMRSAHPTIDEAIRTLTDDGVRRVVYTQLSSIQAPTVAAANRAAVEIAASRAGVEIVDLGEYGGSEKITELLSTSYSEAIATVTAERKPVIVFSAKAVSSAVAQEDDYVARVETAVARMSAELALGDVDPDALEGILGLRAFGGRGTEAPWLLAFQSAEPVADAVGPDLFTVIDAALASGFTGVAVLPIGFAIDDFETMWTLDILAADRALSQDVEFARGVVANDNPLAIQAVAAAVRPLL